MLKNRKNKILPGCSSGTHITVLASVSQLRQLQDTYSGSVWAGGDCWCPLQVVKHSSRVHWVTRAPRRVTKFAIQPANVLWQQAWTPLAQSLMGCLSPSPCWAKFICCMEYAGIPLSLSIVPFHIALISPIMPLLLPSEVEQREGGGGLKRKKKVPSVAEKP